MLQETNLDKALKMVLAGKTVLAAVKKDRRYRLNKIYIPITE